MSIYSTPGYGFWCQNCSVVQVQHDGDYCPKCWKLCTGSINERMRANVAKVNKEETEKEQASNMNENNYHGLNAIALAIDAHTVAVSISDAEIEQNNVREFWERCALIELAESEPIDAASTADIMLNQWRKRFQPIPTGAHTHLAERVRELTVAVQLAIQGCPCSIRERDSGHRTDCYAPRLRRAFNTFTGHGDNSKDSL